MAMRRYIGTIISSQKNRRGRGPEKERHKHSDKVHKRFIWKKNPPASESLTHELMTDRRPRERVSRTSSRLRPSRPGETDAQLRYPLTVKLDEP
jgi:hypothetical protein